MILYNKCFITLFYLVLACFTSAFYKCFFKYGFDIKNTSCNILMKHLHKAVMKF